MVLESHCLLSTLLPASMYYIPSTCRVLPLLCWVSQHCTFTTSLLLTSPLGPTQILQTISSLCLCHVSICSTFLLLSFNVSYPQLEYKHSAPKFILQKLHNITSCLNLRSSSYTSQYINCKEMNSGA